MKAALRLIESEPPVKKHLLLLPLLLPAIGLAQQNTIDWYKISGGGGASTGATYSVTGTIGQPDAGGAMTGGGYSLTSGFWSLIRVVPTPGAPNLTIVHSGPDSVQISWPDTGSYTLQQNDDLTTTNWTASSYTVTSTNGMSSITIPLPVGNLFFRLKK